MGNNARAGAACVAIALSAGGCTRTDREVFDGDNFPAGASFTADGHDNEDESSGSGGDELEDASSESEDDGGLKLDVGSMPDAPPGVGEACPVITAVSQPVPRPADIIFVVDTSGSMWEETAAVVDNLNAFSQQIVDSGVDARVVLIADGPEHGGPCVAPPLGSGNCPMDDDSPPQFTHVDSIVYSTDALHRVVWDFDQYDEWLRPGSVRHVVVVSDDESAISMTQFLSDFVAEDPDNAGFILHAIVSASMCPEAQAIGSVYIDLAAATGGTVADLCDQDFQPVFDELSSTVVHNAIPCEYALPVGNDGQDAQTATVEIDLGEGPITIEPVASPAQCEGVGGGWTFDNPLAPEAIVLCPATCEQLRADLDATVQIELSCAQPTG